MKLDKKILEIIEVMKESAKKEILPRFGKIRPTIKSSFREFKETVTEADIKSSQMILDFVRKGFPGSYSEEHLSEDRFDYDLIWQFDPVDGTDEFCNKMRHGYAMHGALLQKQNGVYLPLIGILYLPGVDKLWYSNGKELHFVCNGSEKAIPKTTRSEIRGYVREVDPNDKVREFYGILGRELGLNVKIFERGGSGSSISDLLEDKLNLIVMNYDYTKEWDLAMAELLIKSKNGFICDLNGNNFEYNRIDHFNRNGYIASIAFKKEEILPLITDDLLIKRL